MPEQRYSIGESCALLDIDRVTLSRWLAAEGMGPQTDVRDKRYKYLTRAQLLDLARLHERTIRDETPAGQRLTGWQREMQQRIQSIEEQIAELRHLLTTIATQPSSSYRVRLPEPRQQPAESPPATELPQRPESPSAASGGRLQPGEYRTLPPIPEGWVTPREMAAMLNEPPRTFFHHLAPRYPGDRERYGTIPYHSARWQGRHAGNYASELLDPEQQEIARAEFNR